MVDFHNPDDFDTPFQAAELFVSFSTNLTWGTESLTAVAKWPVDIAGVVQNPTPGVKQPVEYKSFSRRKCTAHKNIGAEKRGLAERGD